MEWAGSVDFEEIYAGFRIDGPRLQAICGYESYESGAFLDQKGRLSGSGRISFTIPKLHLGEGKYTVCISINRRMIPSSPDSAIHYLEKACTFNVVRNSNWHFSYIYEPEVLCVIQDADGSVRRFGLDDKK